MSITLRPLMQKKELVTRMSSPGGLFTYFETKDFYSPQTKNFGEWWRRMLCVLAHKELPILIQKGFIWIQKLM